MDTVQQIEALIISQGPRTHQPKQRAQQYYSACLEQLRRGLFLATDQQLADSLIPVSFMTLRTTLGRYGSRGQQKYWFDWFLANTDLIRVHSLGYRTARKGELTLVKTSIDLQILLAGQDPKSIVDFYYQEFDPNADIDLAAIDLQSLRNYLRATELAQPQNTAHRQTLTANLVSARVIEQIATYCQGQLPQIVRWSEFGRKYYQGVNLQSVSKIVRHAALGACHQYDIESSVFTWKLHRTRALHPQAEFYATQRYLESKNYYRQRLAELVFGNHREVSVKTIKQLITAIGFGASTQAGSWRDSQGQWQTTSLRDILHSPELLRRFLEDAWVSAFVSEQKLQSRLIYNHYKDQLKDCDILKSESGRLNINRTVSYLYQHEEARVIGVLEQQFSEYKILLRCHDAFYTQLPVPLAELRERLQELMPGAKINHESHRPYRFEDNSDILAHRQHIAEEEQRAQEYAQAQGFEYRRTQQPHDPGTREPRYEDYDSGHWDLQRAQQHYDIWHDPWYEDYSENEIRELEREFLGVNQQPAWVQELLEKRT